MFFLLVIIPVHAAETIPANKSSKELKYADQPPLIIGVNQYAYPFVMRGNGQLYGYDITMMSKLCVMMHRDCRYRLMRFSELIQAVIDKKVDMAMTAITINAERSKLVNFTIPYMLSKTRFLARKTDPQPQFNLKLLQTSTIGIQKGTVFAEEIKSMGVSHPDIVYFPEEVDIVDALVSGEIDLALIDAPAAMYWQTHSAGKLTTIGRAMEYGDGLGIAVNKGNPALLEALNKAILQYLNSGEFKKEYRIYFEPI